MPPQGGIAAALQHRCQYRVSSHAPARGHQALAFIPMLRNKFQVMPPQGGILVVGENAGLECKFQVMPPQGGIVVEGRLQSRNWQVSSHAPARGHRIKHTALDDDLKVSSHAPARGHRGVSPGQGRDDPGFKSCPRKGASANLYKNRWHTIV